MSTSAGEMYGEGSWKADEEYRQGIREFSRGRETEEPARGGAQGAAQNEEGGARRGGTGRGGTQSEGEDEAEW